MNSWYDMKALDCPSSMPITEARQLASQEGVREAVRVVTEIIDEEVNILDGCHEKVFIGGFSQGCAISLATFLLYRGGKLGGCASLGGLHVLQADYVSEVDLPLKRQTKMFLYHGEDDPAVKVETSIKSYKEFEQHHLDFTFETEKGLGHELSLNSIKKLSIFFKSVMTF